MEDKELYNPQNGEVIKVKRPKQFWKDWRFYVYTLIAIMLAIVSFSSCLTACAAINAGVGQKEDASYSVAQRKNAVITTDGGYSGYTFTVPTQRSSLEGYAPCYRVRIYDVDTSTYSLNQLSIDNDPISIGATWSNIVNAISTCWSLATPSSTTGMTFLIMEGYSDVWGNGTNNYWYYYTFKTTQAGAFQETFIEKSNYPGFAVKTTSNNFAWSGIARHPTITTSQQTLFYIPNSIPTDYVFQDVASFYRELGYQDGYGVGNSAGYETGHSAGYNEGYASGNANGYASGYEQATQDYQTGIAFTSYGLYANAQLTLTTDEVIGNYSYMYLFKYVTSNYDEHTVYVLFTQNSSTSQYLGYVLDRNDSDDSTSAVTIGSFSAQSSLAVTITAEQDQYFELYTGFVTSFFDRGSEVIEAVWFSGGTSQTALQNYQDGYDTGYQDGVSAGYGSGYDAGYRVGEVAGINQAEPEALTNTLVAVFQQPFNQIYRFFNFNILGLNVLGLATGLLSVFIIIKVFKKVLK